MKGCGFCGMTGVIIFGRIGMGVIFGIVMVRAGGKGREVF
jgi:hypothetical protein